VVRNVRLGGPSLRQSRIWPVPRAAVGR